MLTILENIDYSFGVLYYTFNVEEDDVLLEIAAALASAKSIRRAEPKIPISIVSIPLSRKTQSLLLKTFTSVVTLPSSLLDTARASSSKMIYRPEAMQFSPFNTTFLLDADTHACSPFAQDLKDAIKDSEIDIAFAGVGPMHEFPIQPDTGVIVFNMNPKMGTFLPDWAGTMRNLTDQSDDKGPLRAVLHENDHRVSAGRLQTIFHCRFRPSHGEPWISAGDLKRVHDQTLLLSGQVRILNMKEHRGISDEICNVVNTNANATRVMVWNKKAHPSPGASTAADDFPLTHSQSECAELLGSTCISLDWKFEPAIAVLGVHLQALSPNRKNESLSAVAPKIVAPIQLDSVKAKPFAELIEEPLKEVEDLQMGDVHLTNLASSDLSFGIIYFSYHPTANVNMRNLEAAVRSAKSLRKVEPRVPIALISGPLSSNARSFLLRTFTSIISVPDELLNRTTTDQAVFTAEAMELSPYQTTLLLNPASFVCSAFVNDLLLAFDKSNVDIAFNGHDPREEFPIHPDIGIIIFKLSSPMKNVLEEWKKLMLTQPNFDEPGSIKNILHLNRQHVKIGRLASAYSSRFRPAQGLPWMTADGLKRTHDQTLPITGLLRIIHMQEHDKISESICDLVNKENATRALVWNKILYPYPNARRLSEELQLAHSQEECDTLLAFPCLRMEWTTEPIISVLGEHLQIPVEQQVSEAQSFQDKQKIIAIKFKKFMEQVDRQPMELPVRDFGIFSH